MDNQKKKVGVIFGGLSSENEVSLATGRYVYSLLDTQLFDGIPLYLDKSGKLWQIPDKLVIQNTTADIESRLSKDGKPLRFEDLRGNVDFIFNALLGKYGEDGCIQGVFEILGVPYTGSGILASALGMDKKTHKKLLRGEGFSLPKDLIVEISEFDRDKDEVFKRVISSIGLPVVIKPTREGSSMGVSVVRSYEGLEKAFAVAFQFDKEVLVEEYLLGLEFTCVVFGNDGPEALTPTEVSFEGDFFTYEGKYMPGKTRTITPARVSETVIQKIREISVSAYKIIGAKGYGRLDGFVVRKDRVKPESFSEIPLSDVEIYIGEPHTGTIMVPSSFVFQQASKFKINLEQKFNGKKVSSRMTPRMLVTKIIEFGFAANLSKKGLL